MRFFRIVTLAIALVSLLACGYPTKAIDVETPTVARTPPAIMPTAVSVITPAPTGKPLPAKSYQSVSSLLASKGDTITDTLAVDMLRVFLGKGRDSEQLYVGGMWTNFFGIEIITDTLNIDWTPWSKQKDEIANSAGLYHAFFSPVDTLSQASSTKAYLAYLKSTKLLIADTDSKTVYWVKWEDGIPWRPTDLEGWIDDNVLVFSKFGNPWYGFLTAIDAKHRKPLLTLQLMFWCQ